MNKIRDVPRGTKTKNKKRLNKLKNKKHERQNQLVKIRIRISKGSNGIPCWRTNNELKKNKIT